MNPSLNHCVKKHNYNSVSSEQQPCPEGICVGNILRNWGSLALLENHDKIGENIRFPYPGNLTVTKTRYPNSDLIQAIDSLGLDKKKDQVP